MKVAFLYKYTSHLGFIDDCGFRFSQPDALEDPLEAQPRFSFGEYTHEDYALAKLKAGNDIPLEELEAFHMRPFPAGRFDEKCFPGLWPASEPRLQNEHFHSIEDFDRAVMDKAVSLLRREANKYGIFSITESIEEPMWAYYAKGHSGVRIGFDKTHSYFSQSCNFFRKMDYSEYAIPVSSNDGMVRIGGRHVEVEDVLNGKLNLFPFELLFQKVPAWSHENEWRMVKSLNDGKNIGKIDEKGQPIYIFSIPSEAIVNIKFGYRASDEVVMNVERKIKNMQRWRHLELFRDRQLPNGSIQEERII